MNTYINQYFSQGRETILVALQIANNTSWDETPATYHKFPEAMAGMYAQFLSNSVNTQVRMTFPKHERQDLGRCNGSYFSPDEHKINPSSITH